MREPKCIKYALADAFPKAVIQAIKYDFDDLSIDFHWGEDFRGQVTVAQPAGIRVLDERDLCEFWKNYHRGIGWMYEVLEGGWMELECKRALFNSPDFLPGLKEYLVVDEFCISIMSTSPPNLIDLGKRPGEVEGTPKVPNGF